MIRTSAVVLSVFAAACTISNGGKASASENARASGATTISIRFDGLVLHVLNPPAGTPRAVLPADPSGKHVPKLTLPVGTDLAEAGAVFPTCKILPCDVELPTPVELRVVGIDGRPPEPLDMSHLGFGATVPGLGRFGSGLHQDVTAIFPPNDRVVAAIFDLNGGKVVATTKHKCQGQFVLAGGAEPPRDFNANTTMQMTFSNGAVLEVVNACSATPRRIHLPAGSSDIVLSYLSNEKIDHFHLFRPLLTGHSDFPIGVQEVACVKEADVPGCGNTQWP